MSHVTIRRVIVTLAQRVDQAMSHMQSSRWGEFYNKLLLGMLTNVGMQV